MKTVKKVRITALALSCALIGGAWGAPAAAAAEADDGGRYVGGNLISMHAEEIIEYTSKQVVEDVQTPFGAPKYINNNSALTNCCGAVAGAIAAGYYDRYYNNMISNWESYYAGRMYKNQNNTYVQPVINSMYTLMKTNVVAEGVSEDECKSGLTQYAKDKGYSLGYSSLGKGTGFDYGSFKSAVSDNKIAILFLSPSNVYSFSSYSGYDALTVTAIDSKHVMIAYGYYEVKYTLSGGTRTDKYLKVSTGIDNGTSYYYKVSAKLDAAYTIEVS